MEIYTIGFVKKTAQQFFDALGEARIQCLIDVRLNNTSQLAGFTKREDLAYFLKRICQADYRHELALAPTADLLSAYRKKRLTWTEYEMKFMELLSQRKVEEKIDPATFSVRTVLLCSEALPAHCHRRLVVDYLSSKWPSVRPIHL